MNVAVQHLSLIDELESSIRSGSADSRVNTLRRVTDLFLNDENRLTDEQVKVFDDVLCLITQRIEKTALVELGKRLAPVDAAPINVIKRLAKDDEIAVAAPVLTGSKKLTTDDLVEIAKTKSQDHLLAISERNALDQKLTDVLLVRGDQKVITSLAKNTGASFSEVGFNRLVERTEGDDALGEIVGLRRDLPTNLLRELLQRATDAVRAKILSLVPPERHKEIELIVGKIGKSLAKTTEHDYSHAEGRIDAMVSSGKLNDAAILSFVQERRQDEFIVALARLSSIPTKVAAHLLKGHRNDAVLLPCKAAKLSWPTVEFILRDRLVSESTFDEAARKAIIDLARRDYGRLTPETAQRTLRFMSVRETVK
jgi:uncharacterized protein (DUF2336 family)